MKRSARVVLPVAAALLLALVLMGATPAHPTQAAGPSYHVVRYGETMTSIAAWYGVSVWSLACSNGIYNSNYIYAGQMLYIPYGSWYNGGCKPYQVNYYPPQNGCYYGCQPPPVYNPPCYYNCYPTAYDCFYRVRWGDTLYSVARRYGTSYWTLANANGLHNANYIYAGQLLRIPGCN